ncbi:DUF389 domain-containing protein [Cellulomonas septica]|uniref:DUF389 domain-containing protein n=1 Tax=Cellulomonas septica TaxID=285080 RepID=A0ABX1JZ91_9CELL|nr:DUF389 domain-containing protein [Cellulomonas septica]NKY38073.1 DUF389 domain-containing protein [Cellulomonas septica]
MEPRGEGSRTGVRRLAQALLPTNQRRTLGEVAERLDLDSGDTAAKRSGFWSMLVLSGLIAVAGVVTDSTATVIGAMIVAPLATPILGIGLGIVTLAPRRVWRSVVYVLGGTAVVVALGLAATLALPSTTDVLTNSQVTGRTSPGLGDLVAAFATGLAGALAITRRDLGDVLPGIAIAISLVPPLGVVGVCLGEGSPSLAAGALLLFGSNAVALVTATTIVLTTAGYVRAARRERSRLGLARPRRAYVVLVVAVVLVTLPMAANTVQATLAQLWLSQTAAAAEEWASTGEDVDVEGVFWQGTDLVVEVRSPGALPPVGELQDRVDDLVPWGPDVVVVHTLGERVESSSTLSRVPSEPTNGWSPARDAQWWR